MVMVLRIPAPAWDGYGNTSKAGKCLMFRPTRERDDFFGDGPEAEPDEAIQVCNGDADGVVCPLRAECLKFALVNNEHYGVWGGLTVQQRHWIRRNIPKKDWCWEAAPPQSYFDELEEQARAAA